MERRGFLRFNVNLEIRYRILESLKSYKATVTEDMCERGIRITLPEYIEPGTEIIFRRNKLIRRYGGGADGQGLKLDRPQNVTIENNLIDTGKPMIAEGMNGCHIYNNAFYGADGIEFYSGRDTIVDNFYNNFVERFVQRSDGAGVVWIKNHGNNIIGPAQKGNAYGGPAHPFVINATEMQITDANALFVDIANGDFRLKENSVAIDFGNPEYGPKTDILGNLRDSKPDAGCYEYGASTFLYGDVSGNKEISAYDAALTAQYAVALIELTPDQIKAADVSGNGEVSAYDAALIAQKAVGLIDKFPVE